MPAGGRQRASLRAVASFRFPSLFPDRGPHRIYSRKPVRLSHALQPRVTGSHVLFPPRQLTAPAVPCLPPKNAPSPFDALAPRTPSLVRQTVRVCSLARFIVPPSVTTDTGAVILARLRRDGYDLRTRSRALSVAALVIYGEEEVLPVAVSAALAALPPRTQGRLVPESGPMPFWEAPEVFFTPVDSFLAAPFSGAVRG